MTGMTLILKIFGIGILTILLEEILSTQGGKEYGSYIKIVGTIIVIGMAYGEISNVVNTVMTMFRF